jgi:hypothetical protein
MSAPTLSKAAWRLGCLLLVLAASLRSSPVLAQSAPARVLFREARQLMDKERFDEACPKLEESLRLDHGMGTQFNLAHCWEKLGRTASAWGLFLDVTAAANAANQPKREAAARLRANALEPQLSRVLIDVREPATGLTVLRAGEEIGRAAWSTAMPVDPGTYAIEASAPGRISWSQEVSVVAPGETVTVIIPELQNEQPEASAVVTDTAPRENATVRIQDEPAGGIGTGRFVTSSVLAAVGVAGIVTGTLFGLKASSETSAARKLCSAGPSGTLCSRDQDLPEFDGGLAERSEMEKHRQQADRAAVISYVGWGVGAAGLAASAIVFLTAPEQHDKSESARLRMDPLLAPGLIGTSLSGSF